jgi:hypothetical protein
VGEHDAYSEMGKGPKYFLWLSLSCVSRTILVALGAGPEPGGRESYKDSVDLSRPLA